MKLSEEFPDYEVTQERPTPGRTYPMHQINSLTSAAFGRWLTTVDGNATYYIFTLTAAGGKREAHRYIKRQIKARGSARVV